MQILLQKTLGSLRPIDDTGRDVLAKWPNGEVVMCDVKKPRNIKFHRLYWAMVHMVAENTEMNAQQLHELLKIKTGHCDVVVTGDGETHFLPRSIAFGKMDDLEFSQFWDRAVNYVLQNIIPGLDRGDLENEVLMMCGIDPRHLAA